MPTNARERWTARHGAGRMGWIWLALACAAVACAAVAWFSLKDRFLLSPRVERFEHGDLAGWQTFGGTWRVNDGVLENLSTARGDKAVFGNVHWSDYVLESDVRLNADPADSLWGDAGLVLRVAEPAIGVDSYDGYYIGIGSSGNALLFGRANYAWNPLKDAPLTAQARKGVWFHLRVLVKGCYFEAAATELVSRKETRLSFFDKDCTRLNGAVGVRSYGSPASWRNFSVRPVE